MHTHVRLQSYYSIKYEGRGIRFENVFSLEEDVSW